MQLTKEQFQTMEDSSDDLTLIMTAILVVLVEDKDLELAKVIGQARQLLDQNKHIKKKD